MLLQLTKSSGGAFFFDAYYGSRMVGVKKLDFRINDVEFSSISDVLGQSSGQFNIIGSVRWISEISRMPNGKKLRDAVIADITGHCNFYLGELDRFYPVTKCIHQEFFWNQAKYQHHDKS